MSPDLRLGQFSGSGVGDVADSLNLFRGDVMMPLPLVSLRGRGGLDIAVTALYASNVAAAVAPSSRVAPTGVLGVGWSLPPEQVRLDPLPGTTTGSFYLVVGGSLRRLVGTDDPRTFELADYQDWTVTRAGDTWEIIREDGSVYTYGGAGTEWGVRWGDWTGPSHAADGERFPVAWNLVRVTSPAGDHIDFDYELVEVALDAPGAPRYTRARYLTGIADGVGQRVHLVYGEKQAFEIMPPHPTPPGVPPVFQDRFETRYLDRLEVHSDDAPLGTVRLSYTLFDATGTSGEDRRKRYLAGLTQTGPLGAATPPLTLEYFGAATAANPGALRRVTSPRGATVSYDYAAHPLPRTDTHKAIDTPGPGYVPGVWPGPGYTVLTWHNATTASTVVAACTWNGSWHVWRDETYWAVAEGTLRVIPGPDFYVVGFQDARTNEHRLLLYRRDPYRAGEWNRDPHRVDLAASTAPPLVRAGQDFVAVIDGDAYAVLILGWDPAARAWVEYRFSALGADHVGLAVAPRTCVAGLYDSATGTLRLALHQPDPRGQWRRRDVVDEPVTIDWTYTSAEGLLGAGATFVAAGFITGVDEERAEVAYGGRLWTWDADGSFGPVTRYDDRQSVHLDNPVTTAGIAGATVGNAAHLFRFDGQRWRPASLVTPVEGNTYRYGYGSDVAVVGIATAEGAVSYRQLDFDPHQGEWRPGPTRTVGAPGRPGLDIDAHVSISGDVLVAGRAVLRRSPTLHWDPLWELPAAADLSTVANNAPAYLAWQDRVEPGATPTTHVVTLDPDGAPQPTRHLPGEAIAQAGPEALVTYRGPGPTQATSLHLHRLTGVEPTPTGDLLDRAVVAVTIDDGFTTVAARVDYDRDTATYDPLGQVAQYVRVRLERGPGYTENVYFNGLRPDVPGVIYPPSDEFTNAREFFSLLNGQLFEQRVVDAEGRLVARTRNDLYTWRRGPGTYTRRRRSHGARARHLLDVDPGYAGELDQRGLPAGLRATLADAGFALADPVTVDVLARGQRWTITDPIGRELALALVDGVLGVRGWHADIAEYDYNPRGQLARTLAHDVDSLGRPVQRVTLTTYAWEVYPGVAQRHQHELVAETRTVDLATGAVLNASASTYRDDWPGAAGVWCWDSTYEWTGATPLRGFPFADGPGPGWLRTNTVLSVTPHGLPRAIADADRHIGGTIFDRAGRFPVAVTALADPSRDEATWCGFESYEDNSDWRITPADEDPARYITTGEAFAGRRRLAFPAHPPHRVGLRRVFAPAGAAQPFLLSCWVKTAASVGAGWEITVGAGAPVVVPFAPTDGQWRFFHHTIADAKAGDTITVEVFSTAADEVLVDAIAVAPLAARLDATVFDPVDRLPVADLSHLGSVRRYGYDRQRRPILTVRDGQPTDASAEFVWRATGAPGPDSLLSLRARAAGSFADFRHGDQWRSAWQPDGDWRVVDGSLHGSGTLAYVAAPGPRFAVQVTVTAEATPTTGQLGFSLGPLSTVWVDGRWELRDGADSTTVAASFDYDALVLVVLGRTVLLLADGRVVLRHTLATAPTGQLTFASTVEVSIGLLAVLGDPVAMVAFTDNAGQPRQRQRIGDGTIEVSSWAYDGQGRAELAGKPVAVADQPGFRPRLLAALDPATGAMGECELTAAYPEDEGYPFARVRFEGSPLGRVVERGQPGRALAIDHAVAPADRHTVRFRYGLNLADAAFGLPAGAFVADEVLDPAGVPSTRLLDRQGTVIATHTGRGPAQTRSQARYDAHGNLIELRQPNFFDRDRPDRDRFVATMAYDQLGALAQTTSPDLDGPVRFVHDRLGRPRFQVSPQQQRDGQLSYQRYDRLGRLAEVGSCESPWDGEQLRQHADEPDWLPGPARWSSRFDFDGDGTDLALLGRLWRTRTPDSEVTYAYDPVGLVDRYTPRVTDAPPQTVTVAHDLTGATTGITHADGLRIDYGLDGFGRVATIDLDGHPIAAYTYRPDGQVAAQTLIAADGARLLRRLSYTSAGWLRETADDQLVETAEHLPTGQVARTRSRFTGITDPTFIADHSYEYRYDDLGRLTAAAGTPGTGDAFSYDPNGNLLTRAGQVLDYVAGTNRLHRVGERTYAFDADGDLTAQTGPTSTAFRFDPVTGLVLAVAHDHVTTVDYSYDAEGNRVLARGPDGALTYLPGLDGQPLLTRSDNGPAQHLIRGPLGLVAIHRGGVTQHVLTGRLGSSRALWNGTGLVAAYNYGPFGDLLGPAFRSPAALDLRYLFTGGERDTATGLYHLGARLYDPVTGRMLSPDPAGQYPSPYLYAGADPVNLVDPDGTFAWSWSAAAAVTIGVLAVGLGVTATVATMGAATPLMVAGALGGGFLIGAGVGSAAYGFANANGETSTFNLASWGVTVALGGSFGLASAGMGLALAPIAASLGPWATVGVEAGANAAFGAVEGLATNAASNAVSGQDPLAGWLSALWAGALGGGIGGALGGALGRGGTVTTRRTIANGQGSGGRIHIIDQANPGSYGLSALIKRPNLLPGNNPNDLWLNWGMRWNTTGRLLPYHSNIFLGLVRPVRHEVTVAVTPAQELAARSYATGGGDYGRYLPLINDGTTYAKAALRKADLVAPPWAAAPWLLGWWSTFL